CCIVALKGLLLLVLVICYASSQVYYGPGVDGRWGYYVYVGPTYDYSFLDPNYVGRRLGCREGCVRIMSGCSCKGPPSGPNYNSGSGSVIVTSWPRPPRRKPKIPLLY
ncbi:hypothetical protein J6590_077825, partial [Homalodisca vitripennis]